MYILSEPVLHASDEGHSYAILRSIYAQESLVPCTASQNHCCPPSASEGANCASAIRLYVGVTGHHLPIVDLHGAYLAKVECRTCDV